MNLLRIGSENLGKWVLLRVNRSTIEKVSLKIDRSKCVKCGKCVLAYPDFFYFDKDFEVRIKRDLPENVLSEVINICPKGAIFKK